VILPQVKSFYRKGPSGAVLLVDDGVVVKLRGKSFGPPHLLTDLTRHHRKHIWAKCFPLDEQVYRCNDHFDRIASHDICR
jgi:hypothetical protein